MRLPSQSGERSLEVIKQPEAPLCPADLGLCALYEPLVREDLELHRALFLERWMLDIETPQRNYRLDSQLITTQLRNGVHGVFGEDEVMLRAQQEAIDANPDYEFYSLNIDAGCMWVRRILERMLEAEGRSGAVAPAAAILRNA